MNAYIEVNGQRLPPDTVFEPPVPCEFKVGDPVVFTNEYGVEFKLRVLGFDPEPVEREQGLAFIYVFKCAWWFAVPAATLRKYKPPSGRGIF